MDGSLMQNFTHSVGLGHTYDEGEIIDRIFGTFDSSYAGGTFAKKKLHRRNGDHVGGGGSILEADLAR